MLLEMNPCAKALLDSARKNGFHPRYALGLNAAPHLELFSGETLLTLTAGGFPFDKDDPAIAAWTERVGRAPTWHETLGHDAARLATRALRALPTSHVSGAEEVKQFHRELQRALLQVNQRPLRLWSTQHTRFDSALKLERDLKFISQTR